jgi:formylglycine-generating enzyme required for sulfatase activity
MSLRPISTLSTAACSSARSAAALLSLALTLAGSVGARGDAVSLLDAVRSNDLARVSAELAAASTNEDWHALPGDVTPLHVAAAMNHREVAVRLLDAGMDVNASSAAGFLPIHWAASQDAVETLDLLIERGADASAATPAGITPLHWAAANDATNVVRSLLLAGADPTARTQRGLTPLHWAVLKRAHEVQIQLAYSIVTRQMDSETNAAPAETEIVSAALSASAVTSAPPEAAEAETSTPPEATKAETNEVALDVVVIESAVVTQQMTVVTQTSVAASMDGTGTLALAIMPEPAPPARPPQRDTPQASPPGRTLIIQLGRNQVLSLVWVESLRLWFGRYEITNGQYRRFNPRHSSHSSGKFSLDGDDQPVVYTSWNDAIEYVAWLNRQFRSNLPPDFAFRLPTASEWRVAARAGTDRAYPWGNTWPPSYGNYSDLSARAYNEDWRGVRLHDDGHPVTCSVFTSGENEWGIAGLAGNVWEWCADWYDATKTHKVRLGGSWDFDEQKSLRVDWTGFEAPDSRTDTVGFRVVAAPAPAR